MEQAVTVTAIDGVSLEPLWLEQYIASARKSANPAWYIANLVAALREEAGIPPRELLQLGYRCEELWAGGYGKSELQALDCRGVPDFSRNRVLEAEAPLFAIVAAVLGCF